MSNTAKIGGPNLQPETELAGRLKQTAVCLSQFLSVPKFHVRHGASLFAQAWENLLRVKLGLSLVVGLEQGHPHSVLEGPCPAELILNTNENTPEPANQGLTRQTRIFQAGRLDLVVAKFYRTVALQDRVWTPLA